MPVTEPIRLRDGTYANAVPIPKGTHVIANIAACNRDPALWGADANEWRPSRWLEPLPREVEEAHIPGVYSPLYVCPHCGLRHVLTSPHRMTFIGGSRACMLVYCAPLRPVLGDLLDPLQWLQAGSG